MSGAIAGMTGKITLMPLDVLKKRLQVRGMMSHLEPTNASNTTKSSLSMWTLARNILRIEGARCCELFIVQL